MKNYKIEYCNYFPHEPYYRVLTCDIGLSAALGSIGYTVLVHRNKNEHFPVFNIISRVFPDLEIEETEKKINKYYQGRFMVDAHLFASNIEILSNIICSQLRYSYNNEMPLKKSSILVNRQHIKDLKKLKKLEEKQNLKFYENKKDQFSDSLDGNDVPY
jgi:hypothetical protein